MKEMPPPPRPSEIFEAQIRRGDRFKLFFKFFKGKKITPLFKSKIIEFAKLLFLIRIKKIS